VQDVLAVECADAEEELDEPEGYQLLVDDFPAFLQALDEVGKVAGLAALHYDDQLVLDSKELLVFDHEGDLR
jgi:hypothetical protein